MIRVSVANNKQVTAHGLARRIETEPDMRIVGIYGDPRSLVTGVRTGTDVIVLDPAGLTAE